MNRLSVGAVIIGLLNPMAGCGKDDSVPRGEAGGSGEVAGAGGNDGLVSTAGSGGAAGGEKSGSSASSAAEAGGPSGGGAATSGVGGASGSEADGPGGGEAGGPSSGGAAGMSGGTAGASSATAGTGAGAAGAPADGCRPITTIELTGTPTRIFSAADKVEQGHLPDGVFDAYSSREAAGQDTMISLNLPGSENYRMHGPSLLELASDPNKTFGSASSAEDPSETAYNYRHWITGT